MNDVFSVLISDNIEDSDIIDLSNIKNINVDSLNDENFRIQNFDFSKGNFQSTKNTTNADETENDIIVKVIQDVFCYEGKELNEEEAEIGDKNYNISESHKKPGRPNKNKGKYKRPIHDKTGEDNILTKIQVHFMNFLVNLANDAIKVILKNKNLNFKNINYKYKKNIKKEDFENLKILPISEILQMPISNKYRNLSKNKDYNKEIYNKAINLDKSNWLKNFFEIKYIFLFKKYYNNAKELNNLNFNGKNIKLSKNTKSFYELINNNINLKNSIIKVAEESYQFNYFQVNKISNII